MKSPNGSEVCLVLHIRGANASFKTSPSGLEKRCKLCYAKTRKGGGNMVGTAPNKDPFDHLKYDMFCKKIGAIFPDEFIDYLLLHNNAELDSNIVKFPNNEINIRYFYGISTRSYTDMESTYEIYKNRLPSKCIPIAEDDCGNQICMSLSTKTYGKIYFFDHEIMDCDEKEVNTISLKDMIFLANSFKNLCEKIEPAKYDDIPVYSPIQVRWNRFVSWLRTKWSKF